MMSADELAQLQSDAAAVACDKPCIILRANTTKTQDGSQSKPTYSQISPAGFMVGLSEPSGGQLQNYDYLIGASDAWQVKMPVKTDVQAQDQLIIEGSTLEVQILLSPRSYPSLLTVLATQIKGTV